MDSIIETQRATHEEIERYEQALADVIMQAPTVQRNIARRDRKAADILTRIGELRQNLVVLYDDAPGLIPVEKSLLSAPPAGQDDLAEFYVRFEKVKDFHSKNQGINARQFLSEIDELVRSDGLQTIHVEGEDEPVVIDPLDSVFSGEETYGKHLDFYTAHTQYMNLKGANRLSYIAYLDLLRRGNVERNLNDKEKASAAYLSYVTGLFNYLVSFFDRALPLINVQEKLREEEDNFASAWEAGQVGGWKGETKVTANGGEGIWCPFCQKNYSKQTVFDAHLKSEKHKKKQAAGTKVDNPSTNGSGAAAASTSTSAQKDRLRAPARLTYLVGSLLTFPPIPEIIARSRGEVERRMALTARERDMEMEETEEAPPPEIIKIDNGESDGESDDGTIFNPLKLPLGHDGRPIPYWLYKLHGLGTSYTCEVCSDATYQGRKAFDKHFSEARHALGMRALGLPNTKHFHEITKIEDCLALAEKLKHEGRQEMVAMDRAVEYEDDAGNVYDKKTYDDLKRQGVI